LNLRPQLKKTVPVVRVAVVVEAVPREVGLHGMGTVLIRRLIKIFRISVTSYWTVMRRPGSRKRTVRETLRMMRRLRMLILRTIMLVMKDLPEKESTV